jgi:tetratricopeptide (TPR) repeat protein
VGVSKVKEPAALAPALEDFKEVVRVTNPRSPNAFHDFHTRELAFMNLARIHYEARQNRAAIYYYGKVARGGEQWLESLYETAWAYYRLGDYERALGNMITLHAPFFKDEYFPESLTVKAIIYYENCRYAEVRRVIDEWFRRGGRAPALPMELGNTEAIKKLVASGLGLSITSWFAAKADVRARRLTAVKLDPPLFRQIGIVLRRDKPRTPVLDAFLAILDDLRRSLA